MPSSQAGPPGPAAPGAGERREEEAGQAAARAAQQRGGSSSEAADAAADAELDALLAGGRGLDPLVLGRAGGGSGKGSWGSKGTKGSKDTKGTKGTKGSKGSKGSKGRVVDESAAGTGKSTGRAAGEAARRAVAALKAQEAAVLGLSAEEARAEEPRAAAELEGEEAAAAAAAAAAKAVAGSGVIAGGAAAPASASSEAAASRGDASLRPLHTAMQEVAPALLTQVLEPNMRWRAGRVAATTRKVAMAASLSVWEGGLVPPGEREATLRKLLPSCKACMSDDDAGTRALACGLLAAAMTDLAGALDGEFARDVQGELVKRLDDADDAVRLRGCALLAAFSRCAPAPHLRGAPCQWSVDALMIHADDTDPAIAAAAGAALEPWANVDPDYLRRAATANRSKHRSPELCDHIVALCNAAL